MKLQICRSKSGILRLYDEKPILNKDGDDWILPSHMYFAKMIVLPEEEFPEITFENSPQLVEIKLIE